jgi:hypothetical protein
MDITSLFTAIARFFILVPMLAFVWQQSRINSQNGDTGRVRLATMLLSVFLILMFSNLIWVNITSAFRNSGNPIMAAKWIGLVSSWLLAGSLWHTWFLFRRIQR